MVVFSVERLVFKERYVQKEWSGQTQGRLRMDRRGRHEWGPLTLKMFHVTLRA